MSISDRFDRRRVLLAADVGRGLVVALLAALAFTHALTFAMLIAIVALYGVGAAFFTPAFDAIVPTIVDPDDLAQANALDQFVRPIAMRLIGPALGGWLIGSLGAGHRVRRRRGVVLRLWCDGRVAPPGGLAGGAGLRCGGVERRLALRTGQRLAVGDAAVGGDRLPRLPRPDRGTGSVRREELLGGVGDRRSGSSSPPVASAPSGRRS